MNIQTKPEWEDLEGVEAWMPELKKLLSDASAAAAQQGPTGDAARQGVAEVLLGFIRESWPQTKDMDKLDDLAKLAIDDLMNKSIADHLAAIVGRTAEYLQLEKSLTTSAEQAESAGDSIRLKNIQSLIDASTQAISSAKTLAASLDDSKSDQKLATLIESTVDAVTKLRSAAAKLI